MKTQRRILERAKQGDSAAIATWLTCSLHHRGLTVTATVEDACLYVLLESAQVPEQQPTIAVVLQELGQLAPSLLAVQIAGKQTGELQPAWSCCLDLSKAAPASERSPHRPHFMFTGMTAIAALIVINVALGFRSMFQLWHTSRDFVDTAIPTIVGSWDVDALVDHASPTLLETTSLANLERSFTQFSQTLGQPQQYEQATCHVGPSFKREGKVTTSHCETAIEFEKTTATVELDLVQQDADWQIDRFSIQPEGTTP